MRILIVEDEEKLAALLKEGFEGVGYAADWLAEGEAAERRILMYHKEYDAITLDWMLPGKNGLQICLDVRAKGITTPIIMLTGRFDAGDKVKALDAGADDYVVKPFSFEELLARVRAVQQAVEMNFAISTCQTQHSRRSPTTQLVSSM